MNKDSVNQYVANLNPEEKAELMVLLMKKNDEAKPSNFHTEIKNRFHHGHLEAAESLSKSIEHLMDTDGPKELGADMARVLCCVLNDAMPE